MDALTRSSYWRQHQNDPTLWVKRAVDLAYSAQVLFERASAATGSLVGDKGPNIELETQHLLSEIGTYPVAFMLAGLALENMLKALRVAQLNSESPIVDGDQRFKALASTHSLVDLAHQAGLAIDDVADETLRTLKDCIVWVGRYPRPRLAEHFMPSDPASPGAVKLTILSASTWASFERLFADANELVGKFSSSGRSA
jgi:hypothetical protein